MIRFTRGTSCSCMCAEGMMKQVHLCATQSDCAGIYAPYHCVGGRVFAQSVGARQWAFVSLHPIFLYAGWHIHARQRSHTRTHTHTVHRHTRLPTHPSLTSPSWLPSSSNNLKTAKQERSDLLFLPHASCPFLQWRERGDKQLGEWKGKSKDKDFGAGGGEWDKVIVTEACKATACVSECVCVTLNRRCAERMWPEVMGKQFCCGGQVLTAHTQTTGISFKS